jgi:hypothetical protein
MKRTMLVTVALARHWRPLQPQRQQGRDRHRE